VETKAIGIAESIAHKSTTTSERCDADYMYDLAYYESEVNVPTNVVPDTGDATIEKKSKSVEASLAMKKHIESTTTVPIVNDPTESKISILMNDMKVWTSKNPDTIIAATAGSFVSILIFVVTILTCRRWYRHRNYKRANVDDETDVAATIDKPNIADESELPGLI
jgi:hypothetical protein